MMNLIGRRLFVTLLPPLIAYLILPAGPVQGSCDGSFVIDSHAVSEAFYEIQLTVEDTGVPLGPAGKLRGSRSIQIFPNEPPL